MEIIIQNSEILIMLAIGFGLFMAWGIGANDVANAMGTSVGSGAITFKQAVIIAVIFEFAGAVLAGGEVTATVRKGILDAGAFSSNPELLVYGSDHCCNTFNGITSKQALEQMARDSRADLWKQV